MYQNYKVTVSDRNGDNEREYLMVRYFDKYEAMRSASWRWNEETGRNDDFIRFISERE